jgi:hypothetical protein
MTQSFVSIMYHAIMSILILFYHLNLALSNGLYSSELRTNTSYELLMFPMRTTWPAHLIILQVNPVITCDERYNVCSSTLHSSLQPPVTSSLLGTDILLNTLISNTVTVCCFIRMRDKFQTHSEQQVISYFRLLQFLYFRHYTIITTLYHHKYRY